MTKQKLSLAEVQKNAFRLPKLLEGATEPLIITQDEQDVLAILSMDNYTHLCETITALNKTLEIIQDEKFMRSFLLAQKGIKAELLNSLERIRQEVDLDRENQEY